MKELYSTGEKAMVFLEALQNVYREEENEAPTPTLMLGNDFTQDVTAMLIAMMLFVESYGGNKDDIIGFTHTLNRLAVQLVMEEEEERDNGTEID